MKEGQPHSLKSDIVVGIGGLAVALSITASVSKDLFSSNDPKTIIGVCTIDKIEEKAYCSPGTPKVCQEWATDILNSADTSLEDKFPSGCERVAVKVIIRWE